MIQDRIEDAHRQVNFFRAEGARKNIIELSRGFRKKGVWDPVLIQSELVAWLELGHFQRARRVYRRCTQKCTLPLSFEIGFKRYSQFQKLSSKAEGVVLSTVKNVREFVVQKNAFPDLLKQLEMCSDFILLSNSSSLSFNDREKQKLLSMKRPLFVYLNIGNPLLSSKRQDFYNSSVMELVVGGFQHVFDVKGRLIFAPWDQASFLGCLLRVNQQFRSRWHSEFDPLLREKNYGLNFNLIDCQDEILKLYKTPTSSFPRELIPTIGWISLSLFEAFSSILPRKPRLWVAGFDLSPNYIFETCNLNWRHDFALEKAALNFRLQNGSIHTIGSTHSSEIKSPAHLTLAGMSSAKLADRINKRV